MYWNTASIYQQAQSNLRLMAFSRLAEQAKATNTLNDMFSGNTQLDLAGRQVGQLLLQSEPGDPKYNLLSTSLEALAVALGKPENKFRLFHVQNAKNHVLESAGQLFQLALSLNPNNPIQREQRRQITEAYTKISQLEDTLNLYEQQIGKNQAGIDILGQLGALGINAVG